MITGILEGHGFDSRWGLRKFFFRVFDLRTLLRYLHKNTKMVAILENICDMHG